ncbi:MAG: lactoylglutathione lyase [Rhodoferax sp.]|nr:lactoylglutathione lyase [Rhodoferax sp.]
MSDTTKPCATARPTRMLHTMLRVADLDRSLDFYTQHLGMRLLRKERYPDGQFTLAFLGYGGEDSTTVLELTHNWSDHTYARGNAYGHIALACKDLYATCALLASEGVTIARNPGPMSATSPDRTTTEHIAFLSDPDGYAIELVQK